ncbi:methyltransferase-like protein 9 [Polypterus senegalus]|uniref:methyltransferase-like protein 9 n=1 Tax=Polypterus senegalus TaxID=55291 RepID=UPI0019625D34|nr:methyltransferase-like protein 9 [Polypterus senegalus]
MRILLWGAWLAVYVAFLLFLRRMWTGKHLRSPLAKSLYLSMMNEAGSCHDTNQWYVCHTDFLNKSLEAAFIQSHLDVETQEFLNRSREKSTWLLTQMYHSFISTVFGPFMSRTNINGWVFNFVFFFFIGGKWVQPSELLNVQGQIWEDQVNSLAGGALWEAGFTVEAFTRLPYLCEGDLYNDYYVLDDAVFVLRLRDSIPEEGVPTLGLP